MPHCDSAVLEAGIFLWSAPVTFRRVALETSEWTSGIRTTTGSLSALARRFLRQACQFARLSCIHMVRRHSSSESSELSRAKQQRAPWLDVL